jgi:hypothetical protein
LGAEEKKVNKGTYPGPTCCLPGCTNLSLRFFEVLGLGFCFWKNVERRGVFLLFLQRTARNATENENEGSK